MSKDKMAFHKQSRTLSRPFFFFSFLPGDFCASVVWYLARASFFLPFLFDTTFFFHLSLQLVLLPHTMGANTSRPGGGSSSNNNGAAPHLKARDLVDYGSVLPNGLYATAQQDYDLRTVRNLILSRKLSPFYKGEEDKYGCGKKAVCADRLLFCFFLSGLADAPEPVVFAPDKHLPVPQASLSMSSISASKSTTMRPRSASNTHPGDPMARNYADQQRKLREKMLYNDVVECPICFLVSICLNWFATSQNHWRHSLFCQVLPFQH